MRIKSVLMVVEFKMTPIIYLPVGLYSIFTETYKSKCTLHHNLYARQNYLRIAILLYYNENVNTTEYATDKSN